MSVESKFADGEAFRDYERQTLLRLRRGLRRVEDEEFVKALLYFGKVLCIEPHYAEAHAYHTALSNLFLAKEQPCSAPSDVRCRHSLDSVISDVVAVVNYIAKRRGAYARRMHGLSAEMPPQVPDVRRLAIRPPMQR